MTERPAWTDQAIAAHAALHGLDIPDAVFLSRLRAMAQKAADITAGLPHEFDREDQPAFAFIPGRKR